jgi:hypothetical protein
VQAHPNAKETVSGARRPPLQTLSGGDGSKKSVGLSFCITGSTLDGSKNMKTTIYNDVCVSQLEKVQGIKEWP